jgi:hypothetical protein
MCVCANSCVHKKEECSAHGSAHLHSARVALLHVVVKADELVARVSDLRQPLGHDGVVVAHHVEVDLREVAQLMPAEGNLRGRVRRGGYRLGRTGRVGLPVQALLAAHLAKRHLQRLVSQEQGQR